MDFSTKFCEKAWHWQIRSNIPRHSVTSIWTKGYELGLNKLRSGKYYWPKENDITLVKLFQQGLTHQEIAEKFSHKYHKYGFKYIGEKLRLLGCVRHNKYSDLLPISDVFRSIVYEWKVTSLKSVLQVCETIVDILRSDREISTSNIFHHRIVTS